MKENKPGFRIATLHAFVSVDKDDEEGICSFQGASGVHWPMICADVERLKQFRPIAEELAKGAALVGVKIKLVKFSTREDLEELK